MDGKNRSGIRRVLEEKDEWKEWIWDKKGSRGEGWMARMDGNDRIRLMDTF